jgi:hypothetical protein
MTPQEITAWIGGLAVKSDRLDALFAANAADAKIQHEKLQAGLDALRLQVAETSRVVAKTSLEVEKTSLEVAKTSLEVAKTSLEVEKTSLEVAKTTREVAETTRVVKEVGRRMGSMATNLGDVAEEYFFNSLTADPRLGSIEFDSVTPNLSFNYKGGHNEFDIVMVNGRSVALIEVKHKAHVNDLTQVAAQVARYRRWRPEHCGYDIYCGLAAFSVPQDVRDAALEQGLFVLQRNGGVFQADAQGMRAL